MSEEIDPADEFTTAQAGELTVDVPQSEGSASLARAAADAQKQRTSQRKWLFLLTLILVGLGFVAMVTLVIFLGIERLKLPPSAQVAAIAAVGVQPFVLIGILTTSVYRDPPSQVSE